MQAKKFGAKLGKYVGDIGGNTYAIPTKDLSNNKAVPLSIIQKYVNEFIKFANANKNIIFLVTPIGCGLAEYKCKDIAPLFKEAININNIYLPKSFWEVLD